METFLDRNESVPHILRRLDSSERKYDILDQTNFQATNHRVDACQTVEVIDARRRSDNALVAMKSIPKDTEEIHITQFLSSIRDSRNHCVPVVDLLDDPFDPKLALLVMPLLRQFNDPSFVWVGEVIDFMDQAIEVSALDVVY